MARLTALPEIDVIHGFAGVIDFYLWKGLACARMWPRNPKSHHSAATIAAAATFGAISRGFALLANTALAAFQEDAADQTRTARDIYMSAVHGKLHEAAMSDFLLLLTECRDSLAALEGLLDALGSIDTDDLQVDVKSSALPAGASTAAHQVTQNTALATIAKLEEALKSVGTDALQVRGSDQLVSIKGVLATERDLVVSGANGYTVSDAVPAGEFWKITRAYAIDLTSATTGHSYAVRHDNADKYYRPEPGPFDIASPSGHFCETWLDPGDQIKVVFSGSLVGDTCRIGLLGHRLTAET